ncbi:MAG: hypothetical protein E7238_03460 [Sarcina sp.]|nr:hypothetical protein [Sarcina sp.]
MRKGKQFIAIMISAILAAGSIQLPAIATETVTEETPAFETLDPTYAETEPENDVESNSESAYENIELDELPGEASESLTGCGLEDATNTIQEVPDVITEENSGNGFNENIKDSQEELDTNVSEDLNDSRDEAADGISAEQDTVENDVADVAMTLYTVTLDANGGYFVNEWDDVLGKAVETTEILNKSIPEGNAVTTFPSYGEVGENNQTASFLGWSLERSGSVISQGHEEYVPASDCTLFAVWDIAEVTETEGNEQEVMAENLSDEESEFLDTAVAENTEESGKEDFNNTDDNTSEDLQMIQIEANQSNENPLIQHTETESGIDDMHGYDANEVVPTQDVLEEAVITEAVYEGTTMPDDAEYWAGHYYMAFDESLTPAEAAAKCEAMGGYLATATSQKEYDLIWSLISAKSNGKPAYQLMGIQKKSDGWYWDDGEEFCFSTWAGFYSKYAGDGYFTLRAGCLGWSDEEIKTAIAWGSSPLYESSYNGWGWGLYLDEGTSASEHNIAICNGTITFTRYANWGGRSSVSATGGMVEYNETNAATGYVCEWGNPVSLKEEHVFLNGQTQGNEFPVKYTYSGTSCSPNTIKVYYDGVELSLNQDYTYEIKSRSMVGAARVNVTGINRYQGLAVKYYYVVPRKVTSLKLERDNENRGLKISWPDLDETDEYDVRWSSSLSDLENNNAKIYEFPVVKGEDNTFYTGTLNRGTTYYVQVRGAGDRKYKDDVGNWSDVMNIKTGNQIILNEFWGFGNYSSEEVGYDTFCRVFEPAQAASLYVALGGREHRKATLGGKCYGMVTFGEAAYEKYKSNPFGVKSLKEITSFENTEKYSIGGHFSVKDGILISHIIQHRSDYQERFETDLSGLYNAVKRCQEGSSDGYPVDIGISENAADGDVLKHYMYAICTVDEMNTDSYSVVKVYDPNTPDESDRFLYLLKDSEGNYCGWNYKGRFGGDYTMSGLSADADENDYILYTVNTGSKINTDIQAIIEKKYNWLEARGILCFTVPKYDIYRLEKSIKKAKERLEKIKCFDGDTDPLVGESQELYWVNGNDPLDLSEVPAGTSIMYSMNNHSITVEVDSDADIAINVADDNTGYAKIVPNEESSCKIKYSYQENVESAAESEQIICDLQKGQEATITKQNAKDIYATGVSRLDYYSEKGNRNEYAVIEASASHVVEKDKLDTVKEYKIAESSQEAQILSKGDNSDDFTVIEASESEMTKKNLSEATVSNLSESYEYTGKAIEPDINITFGSVTLKNGEDYSISFQNNVEPGTATITITGKGLYTGQRTLTFKIEKQVARADISKCIIESIAPQVYTGKEIKPPVSIKNTDGTILKEGVDYTVTYHNNINVGTATVEATGISSYTGKINTTFDIVDDQNVSDSEIIASGICGTNVEWTLYENGIFTLSGSGSTESYMNHSLVPWNKYMTSIKKVIVEKGITKLGACLFFGSENLTDVDLPEGITEIGGCVFQECSKLEIIDLPDSVERFGNWTFGYCTKLSAIALPANTVELGNYTFFGCTSLGEVYFNKEIRQVGNYCFNSIQSAPYPTVFYEGTQSEWEKISFGEKNERVLNATITYNFTRKVKVSEIHLDKESLSLKIGQRAELSVTVKPDKAYNKNILWDSSDDSIALVNSRGIVAGLSEGTAAITAAASDGSGIIAKCEVNVYNPDISKTTISGLSDKTFTGNAIVQNIIVKAGTKKLTLDTDYSITYSNNTNVGAATITITGRGDYEGTVTKYFKINPCSVSSAKVTGLTSQTYTGKGITQNPIVKIGSTTLKLNTDYTLSYKNNIKTGTAIVTITGKGNYCGTKTAAFKINKASLTKSTVTLPSSKVWTGWALTPVPTVKLGGKTLKKGTDFTLAFKNNKNVGTATVTITGKGNYTGTIKRTFRINPKPTAVSKITPGSKKLTVNWKKQASQTTGYQIQYSSRSDFKTQKIVTVTGVSKVSATLKGLAAKHKYYVRVRAFKTVGGTKYYSTWSAAKSAKTK